MELKIFDFREVKRTSEQCRKDENLRGCLVTGYDIWGSSKESKFEAWFGGVLVADVIDDSTLSWDEWTTRHLVEIWLLKISS